MTKLLLIVILTIAATGWTEDWDRFRGPNGSGISNATQLPVEFGPAKNLDWRQKLPFGRSSPILTADKIVATGSEGPKLVTVCLDRKTGRIVWQQELLRDRAQKIYKGNDTATPTPATDGKNFYVFFPDFGLVSYNPAGKERWRFKLGPFNSFYGVSSSPILHGGTLVLVCDQVGGSFIIALDKDTGGVRWRKERKEAKFEAFSTPILWMTPDKKAQVIVSGFYRIDAYDIGSGENIWWVGNQGTSPISTPALANGIIYATSWGAEKPTFDPWSKLAGMDANKDGKISAAEAAAVPDLGDHFGWADRNGDGFLTETEWDEILKLSVSEHGLAAVRAGGSGDQTRSHILWRFKKAYSEITSPLVYRDVLYTVKDGGIITSLNPTTGNVLKSGRSEKAIEAYFASPVAADGKVYLVSNDGKVSVLRADPQWEVLAVNDLGEECQATPAIGGKSIYIRTAKALYSFSQRNQ